MSLAAFGLGDGEPHCATITESATRMGQDGLHASEARSPRTCDSQTHDPALPQYLEGPVDGGGGDRTAAAYEAGVDFGGSQWPLGAAKELKYVLDRGANEARQAFRIGMAQENPTLVLYYV